MAGRAFDNIAFITDDVEGDILPVKNFAIRTTSFPHKAPTAGVGYCCCRKAVGGNATFKQHFVDGNNMGSSLDSTHP